MGGIYFHIPFCRHKCLYCNFFSTADVRSVEKMSVALRLELASRAAEWPDRNIRTVYFGGGTPSLLPVEDIATLLAGVKRLFTLNPQAEITLEANPDDITPEKAAGWRHAGINRLSVGVQSFDRNALAFMGRKHSGQDAIRAIGTLHNAGFDNLTLDLIYGVPGRDDKALENDLETALALGIKHISAYALTVEKGTAMDILIGKGRLPAPDDTQAARQYSLLADKLEKAGIRRYEVSNFAAPGHRSLHNSAYWSGDAYLGIGPSAHSFDGQAERRWNISSMEKYIQGADTGKVPFESETLSQKDRRNERVMTALRTCEGLHLESFRADFGEKAAENLMRTAQKYLEQGTAEISDGALRITRRGIFFTDGISSDLFEAD